MLQLTSPLDLTAEPTLACVHCAKSKVKCDRKIPCGRCVGKKLTCQTRVSQRGAGRSLFNNRSKVLPSRNTNNSNGDPDTIEYEERNVNATSQDSTEAPATVALGQVPASVSAPESQTTHGIYMDWSRTSGGFWAGNPRRNTSDITQKDNFLAQLVTDAATGTGKSSLPNTTYSNTFIQPGLLPTDDPFDFPTPTRAQSPATQIAVDTRCPSHDDDAMDDSVPTISSFPWLEGSPANDDQIQSLEGWPLFQCNPVIPSSACPTTAELHVRSLPVLLKNGNVWTKGARRVDSRTTIEPLLASTREKLIAVLQTLFNEAQQLYGLQDRDYRISALVLPPPTELECLFRTYFDYCEPYYPFIPTASLKINALMEGRNTAFSGMILLLMLATGAMTTETGEAWRQIAHGLIEICRISLRSRIDQNIKLASDPEVLQCALLLTIIAVWSGDKWQMDIAIYQKAMFLEMHLRAGLHDHREAQVARLESAGDVAYCWEFWKEQERANRTSYSWLILDHETCLLQDILSTSFLSVANFNTPIPSSDATWSAPSVKDWMKDTSTSSGRYITSIPPSLNEWVGSFLETNDVSKMAHVSPITLRLLLCHLQNRVMQLRSSIDVIPNRGYTHKGPRHTSIVLLSVQVQEAQELLHKWYDLAKAVGPIEAAFWTTAANMILYHLVVLNTMVSFPEIERLARCGSERDPDCSKPPRPPRSERAYHLENTREIYFHCGQVLRNVRSIPEPARPPWWAGATYRVALIAWANSMGSVAADVDSAQHRGGDEMDAQQTPLLLDVLPAEHASIMAYLNHQGGFPVFSDSTGSTVSLEDSVGVLRHCARFLDTDIKTRFTRGIQRKLLTMANRWERRSS